MQRYETSISVYMPHMNSMQLKMLPGTLVYTHFTLLVYAPEQTFLPHCKYMVACTACVVCIQMPYWCVHNSNKQENATFIYHAVVLYVKICPSNSTHMPHVHITWPASMVEMRQYTWHILTCCQQWWWYFQGLKAKYTKDQSKAF